jgi:hypothetical protein
LNGNSSKRFFGDIADDILDFASALGRKKAGETLVLQVAAEQGRDARSGDTERVTGVAIIGQHKNVAE